MRRIFTAAVLAWALGGCAYREAISKGDAHARQQEWARALLEYERAERIDPDDEEARRKAAGAREQIATAVLADADAALAKQDYAAAVGHVEAVERLEPERRARYKLVRRRIAERMIADARARLAGGEVEAAYPLAAWARRVEPDAPGGSEVLADLRAGQRAAAAAAASEGRYADGRAALRRIGRREPDQDATVRPEIRALEARWAEAARARAVEDRAAGRPGPAFVRFALAASLTADREDALARDAMRARLLADAAPVIEVQVDGEPARATRAAEALRALAPPPVPPSDAAPRLSVRFVLAPVTCAETHSTQVGTHRYVAGSQRAENPDWRARRADVRRADEAVARAEAAEGRTLDDLNDAERRLWEQRRDLRMWAIRERESAVRRFDEARKEEQRAQSRLQAAYQQRERRDVEARQRDLDSARRRSGDQREALRRIDEDAQRRWAVLGGDFDQVADLRERRDRARRGVEESRTALRRADRALDDVPLLIDEPVYADFRYPVEHWTRRCEARAELTLRSAAMALDRVEPLQTETLTQDRAHHAYVRHGIAQDRVAYPVDEDALRAAADEQLVAEARERVRRARAEWPRVLVARGHRWADTDVERATASLVSGFVLDPSVADPRLRAFLRARYDVEDPEVLVR